MNFSVVIPVYNTDPNYLLASLESTLRQTLPPSEVLIIDDGSDDPNTKQFLEGAVSASGGRMRLFTQPRNAGISNALNLGLLQAQNEWIVRMDADDIMLPQRLERQASVLQSGKVDVLGSQIMYFGGEFGACTNHPPVVDRSIAITHSNGWFLNHPTVAYNRTSVLAVGGYDPQFDGCEDMELWYRMLANGASIANLGDVLLMYRIHASQVTGKRRNVDLGRFKSYLTAQKPSQEQSIPALC